LHIGGYDSNVIASVLGVATIIDFTMVSKKAEHIQWYLEDHGLQRYLFETTWKMYTWLLSKILIEKNCHFNPWEEGFISLCQVLIHTRVIFLTQRKMYYKWLIRRWYGILYYRLMCNGHGIQEQTYSHQHRYRYKENQRQ
jgi:hypothetical protein